ncbi:hypothetical protein N7462_004406 [Penicillium macrosclerotiorum]|uniref:uncharacterized protein n=1 Tax=Penicillium macrosclerotiorum TaxID=303699 RepID=UPI00254982CD|nr:uncharacterized protein N7462_004406 [Penicillium macrosclerotiorum]KAJ5690014.1 hypothetical protein N7462_004406 [Penicillium macrosclerotiorum]
MARRYEIDELLWLRSSPLVAKPPGLPPIEEWILTDPHRYLLLTGLNLTQQPNANNRRLATPITHLRRLRTADPAFSKLAISLAAPIQVMKSMQRTLFSGPPKTAFASSRIGGGGKGSFDLTERPVRTGDSDDKGDRFNLRDRLFKDKDTQERESERRDGRAGGLNGRRGEREDWNAGRPRRGFGPDEQDRKPRRNGEFDRWENRENPRDPNTERGTRERDGRFPVRKDGQPGRAKYEGSWFRDENSHEGADPVDDDKPATRNREWRRDRHGADRDWTRGAKIEQEPEWLDSNDRDEPRRAHTQEDFERWKERMKAGSGAGQSNPNHEEKRDAHDEPNVASQKTETNHTDGETFNNPSMADNSMERFFGMLGDPKPSVPDVGTPMSADSGAKKDSSGGKLGKSSRFAGLFSPPPESPSQAPEPNPFSRLTGGTPVNPQDPDQEGFQRILQMLGGGGGGAGRSHNGTPNQGELSNQPRPMMQLEQPRMPPNIAPRDALPRPEYMGAHELPMSQNIGKEPQSHEREHLLRLMQQVRVGPPSGSPSQQSPPNAGPPPPPGLMPEMMPRPPPGLTIQKGPNFLDDPAIANMQRPDSDQLRRRAANGPPPMGYFDDVPFPPQGAQGPMTPGGSRPPQGQPPMPLQRPPGLDHMPPPPGWAGQPPQQGNGPSPMGPPPGIPTPGRGPPPNFPPGMIPMPPRGLPPGMMPPPGYMGGPPPPGFPPMPPNPEAMMGLGPGQGPFGPGNPGPGLQGPPPSSRHLLEMFGQPNGGDGRGGMVVPGQFR